VASLHLQTQGTPPYFRHACTCDVHPRTEMYTTSTAMSRTSKLASEWFQIKIDPGWKRTLFYSFHFNVPPPWVCVEWMVVEIPSLRYEWIKTKTTLPTWITTTFDFYKYTNYVISVPHSSILLFLLKTYLSAKLFMKIW